MYYIIHRRMRCKSIFENVMDLSDISADIKDFLEKNIDICLSDGKFMCIV